MNGDFSRTTFDSVSDYSDVLFQQGRVVTDADLNEQGAIARHRAERTTEDLVGHCGAPVGDAGFAVEPGVAALAVHALTVTDFIVAGEDGVVLKVAGTTITRITAAVPIGHHLRGVHCSSQSGGLAVGDSGTLLNVTLGASPTASEIASGVTAHLRAVQMVNATKAFAVGDDATILAISNLTTTPTVARIPAPVGVTAALRGVHFVSETKGYAVGDRGTLLAIDTTVNPSVRLIAMPTGIAPNLNAVRFSTATTGLAVGDGGEIIGIAVSGSTITLSSIDPGQGNRVDLLAVAYESGGKAYAVGAQATVLEINGTTVIRENLTGFSADLCSVSFSGASGVAVGRSNKVIALPGLTQLAGLTLPATSLIIKPGRIYVDGVSADRATAATLLNQPDLPVAGPLDPNKKYLVYLDVWDRLITHLQDPKLRDVALGGADTAARAQTLAQVKAMPVTASVPNCKPDFQPWNDMVAPASSRLRARVQPQPAGTSACEVAATAGYRRLENQLYRVEIHKKGKLGDATFKWSRENGSVVFPVAEINIDATTTTTTRATVHLGNRGRDDHLGLKIEGWVEILDEDLRLAGNPGPLMRYKMDGNDPMEIVLEGPVPQSTIASLNGKRGLHIRRWDHVASTDSTGALSAAGDVLLVEGVWLDLEDGVQVFFEAGKDYRSGDYWQVPARTITGDIEWPDDDHGAPAALPPAGVTHHYCCLAMVEVKADGSIEKISDCRNLFPAVTQLINLLYVGGDGQEGLAGKALSRKLQVRVMNGGLPVPDAKVSFTVESGGGQTSAVTAEGNGIFSCNWTLGGVGQPQAVRAELHDVAGEGVAGQLIRFTATIQAESLEYVSGDGQEGMPGDTLRPLIVRVVDAAGIPIANASVTFTVAGGGSVSSPSASTNGVGIAQIQWTLGGTEHRQQVIAKLSAPPAVSEKNIIFNANLSTAAKVQYTPPQDCPDLADKTDVQAALDALCRRPAAGGSCRATVGEGGEFLTIAEALAHLIEEKKTDVCLCLLPGDHVLQSLDPKPRGIRLAISGCGAGTRLGTGKDAKKPTLATHFTLPSAITFAGFSSIEFSNLDVLALVPIVFIECGQVVLDRLTVSGVAVTEQKFPLIFATSASRIVLHGCQCSAFTPADLKAVASLDRSAASAPKDTPGVGELFQQLRLSEFSEYAETLVAMLLKLPLEERRKYAEAVAKAIEKVTLPQPVKDGFNAVVEAILQSAEKTEPFRIFGALLEARALLGLHGEACVLGVNSRVISLALANNRFEGKVSLYGVPGTTTLERNMNDATRKLLSGSPMVGSIELSSNTFGQLVAGNEVDEWLGGSGGVTVKRSAHLWDNVFARTDNELLARTCNILSSSFARQIEKPLIGMTCMALRIAAMANASLSWDAEQGLSKFVCWRGTLSPKAKVLNDIRFDER